MDRKNVYKLVDMERDYQDGLGSNRTDGRVHNVAEELVLMERYLRKAFDSWSDNAGDKSALTMIKKVVALGVRAMENNHG